MGVEGPDVSALGVVTEGDAEDRWDMLSCIILASVGLSELGALGLVMVERLGGWVAKASSRNPVMCQLLGTVSLATLTFMNVRISVDPFCCEDAFHRPPIIRVLRLRLP